MQGYVIVRIVSDIPLGEELYERIEDALETDDFLLEREVVKGSERYQDLITGKGEKE